MLKIRVLLVLVLALSGLRTEAQDKLYPTFPLTLERPQNIFYLDSADLLGISDGKNLQIWDVKSRAFLMDYLLYTSAALRPKIKDVKYVAGKSRIAVLSSQGYKTQKGDSVLQTFSAFDPVKPEESTVQVVGDAVPAFIRYVYGDRIELPAFPEKTEIFQYFVNEKTGKIYLLRRDGNLEIYQGAQKIRTLVTGVSESPVLFVSSDDLRVMVYDKEAGHAEVFFTADSKTLARIKTFNVSQARQFSDMYEPEEIKPAFIGVPETGTMYILDSLNRFRTYDILNNTIKKDYVPNMEGQRVIDLSGKMMVNSIDSAVVLFYITEDSNGRRKTGFLDTKSGVSNVFSTGAWRIINRFSVLPDNKFKLLTTSDETEIDLNTLSEKIINRFAEPEPLFIRAGWENGFLQVTQAEEKRKLRVFTDQGSKSVQLYEQDVFFSGSKGYFAGICAPKRWQVGLVQLNPGSPSMQLRIADDKGQILLDESIGYIQQTIYAAMPEQHLFSKNGEYFCLKEITGYDNKLVRNRLRVYETNTFKTIVDTTFTEVVNLNLLNRGTAIFGNNGNFYFVNAETLSTGETANYLNVIDLTTRRRVKKIYLQVGNGTIQVKSAAVNRIAVNEDKDEVSWLTSYYIADPAATKNAFTITSLLTGKNIRSSAEVASFPEVLSAYAYPDFVVFRCLNRLIISDYCDATCNGIMEIVPVVNEQTAELATIFSTWDKEKNRPVYYERTNSDNIIFFQKGLRSYRRSHFDVFYNRPDVVLSRFSKADSATKALFAAAVAKRLSRSKASEHFSDADLPVIKITSAKIVKGFATFSIQTVSGLPAKQFIIKINGNKHFKNASAIQTANGTYNFSEQLPFWDTLVEIVAVSSNGLQSLPASITLRNMNFIKPKLHVLAVSVGKYTRGFAQLNYTVKDGRDILEMFGRYNKDTLFKEVILDSLFDKDASESNIKKWLAGKKNLDPSDVVVVFYSGHGFLNKSSDLLLTTATSVPGTERNTISYTAILDEMDKLAPTQKLFLIDACSSGDFDRENTLKNNDQKTADMKVTEANARGITAEGDGGNLSSFSVMQNMFSFSEDGNGTVVISAAGGRQAALEAQKYNNGFFTYAIKEAFINRKASYNPTYLGVNELVAYLKARVSEMSLGTQIPNMRVGNQSYKWGFPLPR